MKKKLKLKMFVKPTNFTKPQAHAQLCVADQEKPDVEVGLKKIKKIWESKA